LSWLIEFSVRTRMANARRRRNDHPGAALHARQPDGCGVGCAWDLGVILI
jgi:hypothetical protein